MTRVPSRLTWYERYVAQRVELRLVRQQLRQMTRERNEWRRVASEKFKQTTREVRL